MVSRFRNHLLLLACFAVLFNLLMMPLDRSLRNAPVDESLILGSFCSIHGLESLPKSLLAQIKVDQTDLADNALGKVQSGDCCCCHAGQAGVSGDYFKHLFPRFWPDTVLLGDTPLLPLPRHQRPSLNPRASPLV
ncbi:DUF2946 domain-containing protein [Pseudomonas monteilii]|uniref:DUF2946 domain-containing protein n=2 Tax=Pseudomonas TaxID=286 RepID=UPI002FBDF1C3